MERGAERRAHLQESRLSPRPVARQPVDRRSPRRAGVWGVLVGVACLFATGCEDPYNTPPTLGPVADLALRVDVGGTIALDASDPDGDALAYAFVLDPAPPSQRDGSVGAPQIDEIGGGALFRWVPTQADAPEMPVAYGVTFVVTDARGARTERTATITVTPRAEAPPPMRFVEPRADGVIALGPCVEGLEIEVDAGGRDDESVAVTVEQPLAARCEGGACPQVTLSPGGPGARKTLSWCPSPAQLDAAVHHPMQLDARALQGDDQVRKRWFARFHRPTAANCPGLPPTVSHTPPDAVEGQLDYVISADIDDDLEIKAAPVLAYAFDVEPPASPLAVDGWAAAQFTLVGDGPRWQATIPNRELGPGEEATLTYVILVTDNDDPASTRCDHAVEAGPFQIVVRGGDGDEPAYAPCSPCLNDGQCGGGDDLCVNLPGGGYCTRRCAEQADCGEGEACLETKSIDGAVGRQCLPVSGDCGQICMADRFEGDGRQIAAIEPGLLDELSLCDGDVDEYRFAIEEGQSVRIIARFDGARGDLDLGLKLPGSDDYEHQSLGGGGDEEAVYEPCAPKSGDAVVAVWPYDGQLPRYTLEVEVSDGACDVACAADEYEQGGGDTREAASVVALPFSSGELTLCADDPDFFTFAPPPGALIRVDLRLEAPRVTGDLGLRLWRDGEVIGESAAFRQAEAVEAVAGGGGAYVVEVFGQTARSVNRYTLRIESMAGASCDPGGVCEPGQLCIDGVCTDGRCSSDRDCDDAQVCVAPRIGEAAVDIGGRCAPRCADDRDCRAAESACVSVGEVDVCIARGSQRLGERCARNERCAGDAVCLALPGGYCAPLGCDACGEGTACARLDGVDGIGVIGGDAIEACLVSCRVAGDCRFAEGYMCGQHDADAPVCQPGG